MLFEVLPKEFVESYKDKVVPFGPLGYVVYKRTYARVLPDGKTEEWYQTIERVVDGNISLEMNHRGITVPEPWLVDEAKQMYDYMFNLKVLPGGRGLWASGTQIQEKHGGALTNCYYINIEPYKNDPTYPFCFAMDMLMVGAGVGYGVSQEFVDKLPVVKEKFDLKFVCDKAHADYEQLKDLITLDPVCKLDASPIEDTREDWVLALGSVISDHYNLSEWPVYSFDVSKIRPYGADIKGFGGKASGPKPLMEMLRDINKIFNNAVGRKLTSVECMDIMCLIGRCVVAGNVRRCLPKGSMVYTDRGITQIENIAAGDLVHTQAGLKPVVNTFQQGKQKLVRIQTKESWFECTANHKMAVQRNGHKQWVVASKLTPGDLLIKNTVDRSDTVEGTTFLPGWSYSKPAPSTTCLDIAVPTLDTEMAWFIGLFHADGYTYANKEKDGFNAYVSLVVGAEELDIAERAKVQLERFGVKVELSKRKDENSYQLRTQSKQLAWYLHDNIKQPNTTIDIPWFIRNGSREIKLAYLSGVLDGDGAANNRPVQLASTVYKSFAEQLFSLANYIGLRVKLKAAGSWPSRPENWQKQYFVTVIDNTSREELEKYSNKKLRRTKNLSLYETSEIISITPVEEEVETYDIEVLGEHEFFCNGFLTHNSAEIALGDVSDTEFVTAKTWGQSDDKNALIANHRWASNNSVVVSKPEDVDSFVDALLHNGEPGFFNREMHQNYGRLIDGLSLTKDNATGTNPCLVPGTLVTTKEGIFPIEDLIEKTVTVWDGLEWRITDKFKVTAENQPVYDVTLHNGQVITATEYHEFDLANGGRKQLKDLVVGDELLSHNKTPETRIKTTGAYLKGFLLGDGTRANSSIKLDIHPPKYGCINRLKASFDEVPAEYNPAPVQAETEFTVKDVRHYKQIFLTSRKNQLLPWVTCYRHDVITEVLNWEVADQLEFIAGYMDADGSAQNSKNGFGYQVTSVNRTILETLQMLLIQFGVMSKISVNKKAGTKDFGPTRGGVCNVKELHRLTVSQSSAIILGGLVNFERLENHGNKTTAYKPKSKAFVVTAIDYSHVAEKVYCCETDEFKSMSLASGVVIGRCGEISLESGECCNLADIILPNCTSVELFTAVKIAVNYTKRVTLAPYTWQITKDVVARNRRLGIGVTGVVGSMTPILLKNLDVAFSLAQFADYEISKRLAIPPSVKLTTVKPSGTLSLLAGCSPGVHYPVFEYYIRRVQFSNIDPLVPYLQKLGFESYVPERLPNAVIVKFPMTANPDNNPDFKSERDVNFEDKLNVQMLLQKYWADNSVSCTLTFREDEHEDVKRLLKENFYNLKSTSALPISDIEELMKSYPDLPYQPITKEEYTEMRSKIKVWPGEVKFSGNASDYLTEDGGECAGGSCPVR